MELIERYIYAVTRSLPEKQRTDIEQELRALIEDMVEQKDAAVPYQTRVTEVLIELGSPVKLADNYRGTARYLIGPRFYDKYLLVLRVALTAVFIAMTIGAFINGLTNPNASVSGVFKDYISMVWEALLQAFLFITVGFFLAERRIQGMKHEEKDFWTPSMLPPIPEQKARIRMSEPIVSIALSAIFLTLMITTPQVFAVYFTTNDQLNIIPVFDAATIHSFAPLLVVVFILGLLRDSMKLFFRRWDLRLGLIGAVLTALSAILSLILLTSPNFWNADFAAAVGRTFQTDFTAPWAAIRQGFLIIFIIGSVIDIAKYLVNGIRYGVTKVK